MSRPHIIRAAGPGDAALLDAMERRCFETDRISRRQWRYLLTRAHAETLIGEDTEGPTGYVLLLYNQATSVARLYSIAVETRARRAGVGRALALAAEDAGRARGRAYLRLEIRSDNPASLGLFEGLGYRRFGLLDDYYEDHMQAVRLEKRLGPHPAPVLVRVPFYEQTLELTCGASSLMMAMKALRSTLDLDRTLELRIWREATTIYMTSGHGGCGPFGLALSAHARGFEVEIFVSDPDVPLIDSVRSAEKKEVMRLVHEDMLRVELRLKGGWRIKGIKSLALGKLDRSEQDTFIDALEAYLSTPWRRSRPRRRYRYDLAILHDRDESMPPSDPVALERFVDAARALDIDAELIEKRDYARLAEYDALFIRVTTAIGHYSYRFANRAQNEGLVVIDDPDSILRCTNKVYLEERLRAHRVPTPKTLILRKGQEREAIAALGLPVILKIPDGSFSRGVYKAESADALERNARSLFRKSDLILAQEYLYTPFDWRVGILGGEPLFVCKYVMSKGHWQIYDHTGGGTAASGDFETLAVEDAPRHVVETALQAARLVGDGLYGVDLKETAGDVRVIEVNDNPSIDSDVEDLVLGEALYQRIIGWFRQRLDSYNGLALGGRRPWPGPAGDTGAVFRPARFRLRPTSMSRLVTKLRLRYPSLGSSSFPKRDRRARRLLSRGKVADGVFPPEVAARFS